MLPEVQLRLWNSEEKLLHYDFHCVSDRIDILVTRYQFPQPKYTAYKCRTNAPPDASHI